MNSVQRTIAFLLSLTLLAFLCLQRVEACWQSSPSARLRARTIAGTVTANGKPSGGVLLRLHGFLGPYAFARGNADPHVLAVAVSEKNGTFNFGEVSSGEYVVFVGPPSDVPIEVQLVKPKIGENDTIAIDNFGDDCISTAVSSAGRRRLTNQ